MLEEAEVEAVELGSKLEVDRRGKGGLVGSRELQRTDDDEEHAKSVDVDTEDIQGW